MNTKPLVPKQLNNSHPIKNFLKFCDKPSYELVAQLH